MHDIFKAPPNPFERDNSEDRQPASQEEIDVLEQRILEKLANQQKEDDNAKWHALSPEEQMKALKSNAIKKLTKHDPLVREMVKGVSHKKDDVDYINPHRTSPVTYDDNGNLLPPTRSVLVGTGKDQAEYMRAVKEQVNKRLGVDSDE
ncbi:MAG: hypothetical protein ABJN26_16670 [Stappiaceae bacterium]